MTLLAATRAGLFALDGATGEARPVVEGATVTALATGRGAGWALLDRQRVVRVDGADVSVIGELPAGEGQSVAPLGDGAVVIGRTGARLTVMSSTGDMRVLDAFEEVPGRDEWENPAGPTPDLRSIAVDEGGRMFVNAHVGGVWWTDDGGATWTGAVEPDADVHEVTVDGSRVAVAAAIGFGWSDDRGATWSWTTNGLHASYARAVALDAGRAYVSSSTGPFTHEAAVYAAELGSAFVRCAAGLPEWFTANVDSGCLDARAGVVAIGTAEGVVYVSDDDGRTWSVAADGLPPVIGVRLL